MNKENRKIPIKNYLILALIVVIVLELTFYIKRWVDVYKTNLYSTSPLKDKISEVTINELDETLSETSETILYIGYTNNKNIYNMEKKLLKKIKEYELSEIFMYLDVTNNLKNDEYITYLKEQFPNSNIIKAPMFIYIKNGEVITTINPDGEIVDVGDLQQIIDMYEIN